MLLEPRQPESSELNGRQNLQHKILAMRISTTRTIPRSLAQFVAVAVLTSSFGVTAWARQNEPTLAPPIETVTAETEVIPTTEDALPTSQPPVADDDFEEIEGATPLMQGPVHEAFAERFNAEDEDPMVVSKEPPQMIDEQPPEYRPDGENIEWIPGYWGWDIASDDFVWVSGVWRQIPPGQQWIPGYWTQIDEGWRWISGFWMAEANEQIVYLPPPPQSIDNGPSSPAPGPDHFWVSGYWGYNANSNYGWQSGYWHPCQQNWVWIPARYIWTPSGYVYRAGYWDFEVNNRGMLFAPVAFQSGFNRVYRPTYVIETSPLLFANLYVSPGASYYYFGSTYAHTTRRPCYPWVSYYQHGYDPMFSYYAYQRSHRTWLRGVSSLQHQIAAMPHSGNGHRFTVADQLRLNHGLNSGHVLNPGQAGIPGQPQVINPGGHLHGTNNVPNSMFHVASLTSLAAKNNQKVDFKTPFAVKSATAPNNIANAAQFNEFSKKRRDLEAPLNPLDKANALVQSNTTNLRDPKSQPAVNTTLKQIELIKPQDKSRLPRDLKIGSGVSASTFAKSSGIPTNSATAVNGSTNAKGPSGIGSNITGTNIGGTSGTGANVLGGVGTKPNNTDPNKAVNPKRQHEAQQFSQLFGGSDKTPLDTKQLESLRSFGPSNKNVGSQPGNTKGTINPNVTGTPKTGQGLGGGLGGGIGNGGNSGNKNTGRGNVPGNSNSGGNIVGGNILGGAGQGTNAGPGVGGNILGGTKPNSGSGLPGGVLGGSKPPAGTGAPQGGTVFKPPMNPPTTGGNSGVQGGGLGNGGVLGGGRPNTGNPSTGSPKNGAPKNGTPNNGAPKYGGFRPGTNGGNNAPGSTKGGGNRPGGTGLGSGLGSGGLGSGGLGSGGLGNGGLGSGGLSGGTGGSRSGGGLGSGLGGSGSTSGSNLSGGNKGSGTIGGGNIGGNRLGGNPGANSGGGRLGGNGNRGGNGEDKGGRK